MCFYVLITPKNYNIVKKRYAYICAQIMLLPLSLIIGENTSIFNI